LRFTRTADPCAAICAGPNRWTLEGIRASSAEAPHRWPLGEQDLIHSEWGWVALVGSTLMLPDSRGRRVAAGALGALLLAMVGLQVGQGSGALPESFAAVEMALVVIGFSAFFWGVAWAGWWETRGWMAAALGLAGVVLAWGSIAIIARAAPLGGTAAAFGVVGGAAGLAWAAARQVLARVDAVQRTAAEVKDSRTLGAAAAGVLLAGWGPHVLLVFLGVLLASLAAWHGSARSRGLRAALPAVVAVGALIPAGWLLLTIAGEQGLALTNISELPLSPAAESLLAPLLLLAAWLPLGLWPLERTRVAGIAGVAGLLLVSRVIGPALPEGLDHWRRLAYPILAIGMWQGTASGRWPAVMVGGALMGLASGSVEGPRAAWCLGGAALVAELVALIPRREAAWVGCAAVLAAGYGAWPAAVAGLRAEVVYTTLTVAGIAVLLAAGGRVDPSHGQIHISRFES